MFKELEEISQSEMNHIKKTIQDLFRQTCILQVKCDPVTLIQTDNPRYRVCTRHREFISDYFAVLDCELIHDPQEHIFRIVGDGILTEKLNLVTTKFLILLKMIYHDKIMGEGLNATVTNLWEIRQYGVDTGLITRKLNGQEWKDALLTLKTHQIIEVPGAIANVEDDTPIYIYSTVNIFCSATSIQELLEEYREILQENALEQAGLQIEEMKENMDGMQYTENLEEEKGTYETGKEDIYQNVSQ